MDLGLTGKIALVTGGSKGIGKGIARSLSAEGCRVALCARTRSDLETAAAEITGETGNEVAVFTADLTRPEDAAAFVEGAVGQFGCVDILVNNAGAAPGGVIETLTEDDWAESLQLKFMGYVRCTKAVLPHMQRQGKGRIVNLIGNDGIKHSYWEIAPGAANAAGQNFTMSMAGQHGEDHGRNARQAAILDQDLGGEEADEVEGHQPSDPEHITLRGGRLGRPGANAREHSERDQRDGKDREDPGRLTLDRGGFGQHQDREGR